MITTVINYCTNDYRFLSFAVEEAKKFSQKVIVVCADHFFDGSIEDQNLLSHSYLNHPDVEFVEYAFDENNPYGLYPRRRDEDLAGVQYWHSTSRYIGYHYLPDDCEYVLFLDADEIADGERMKNWVHTKEYQKYDAIRFVSYFYFKSAEQRAKKMTRCGLMLRKSAILPETLLDVHERRGTFLSMKGDRIEDVRAEDGSALFHHFSWVKNKKEAMRKVETWGHKNDRLWVDDIEREFSNNETQESIYHLDYHVVEPYCNPLSVRIPTEKISGSFKNVSKAVPETIFSRSVKCICDL